MVPALQNVAWLIDGMITGLSINSASSTADAINQIIGLPNFNQTQVSAFNQWRIEYNSLTSRDHDKDGPTEQAERVEVNKMIKRICDHSKMPGINWGNCGVCPP